jgi:voltage-gated potassium channel
MHSLLSRKHITEKDNFSYLLFSLFFLLLSSAIVDQFFARSLLGQSLVIAFTVISMTIAVWSLRSSKYVFNTALGLVFATIIISAVVIFLDQAELEFIHLLLMLYFFLMTLRLASQQALFADRVTLNSIIGSICIFLLLGLIWVILYLLLAEFTPNAFSGLNGISWQENFPDFIYFSFVTLTTLGFGDLLPISPLARFLVYTEAIVGVFYMAIVVSSLVSSGTAHIQEKGSK